MIKLKYILYFIHLHLIADAFLHSGRSIFEIDKGSENGFILYFPENDQNSTFLPPSDLSHFVPVNNAKSVTLKSTFGSISSQETVYIPAYHRVSTFFSEQKNYNEARSSVEKEATVNNQSTTNEDHRLSVDLIAHIVNREIFRQNPVLRVLFYTAYPGSENDRSNGKGHDSLCLVVSLFKGREKFFGSCSPNSNSEACLVEITLPSFWWPSACSTGSHKSSQATVEYKIFKDIACGDSLTQLLESSEPPPTFKSLGAVTLSPELGEYDQITDGKVKILLPRGNAYPNSKIVCPVCFDSDSLSKASGFRLKVKVKNSLKVVDTQIPLLSDWDVKSDINNKQNSAIVTSNYKDDQMVSDADYTKNDLDSAYDEDNNDDYLADSDSINSNYNEIFALVFQVGLKPNLTEDIRGTFGIEYLKDEPKTADPKTAKSPESDSYKLSFKFTWKKDETQAVFGLTRCISLINTAVLNGKQVSQQLKIFRVSHAGEFSEVTLQSSCQSLDESIVKVSPSCSSVYIDGSEIRGSFNATILIKYGNTAGQANFIVWIPKFPLDLRVSDEKLSQIKGWKTHHLKHNGNYNPITNTYNLKPTLFGSNSPKSSQKDEKLTDNEIPCKLRYQQSYIQVFAQFTTTDYNSGREFYFFSHKALVLITNLVQSRFKISDPKVALVRGDIIEGLYPGEFNLQIVSPVGNRVLASKLVLVTNEKESIEKIAINPVAGFKFEITHSSDISPVWQVKTNVIKELQTQYQQCLLDILLYFSDKTVMSLFEYSPSDYHLTVTALNKQIITYAPLIDQLYPRVIAIGHGMGQIHASLEIIGQCQRKRVQLLGVNSISIPVDFTNSPTHLQNDANFNKFKNVANRNYSYKKLQNLGLMTSNLQLDPHDDYEDDASYVKTKRSEIEDRSKRTEMEFFALLTVFSIAASIFFLGCFIFRYRPLKSLESSVTTLPLTSRNLNGNFTQKVVATAGEWIWLGRNTLEGPSHEYPNDSNELVALSEDGNPVLCNVAAPVKDTKRASTISYPGSEINIRITNNPLNETEPSSSRNSFAKPSSTSANNSNNTINKPSHSSNPPPVPMHRTTRENGNTTKCNKKGTIEDKTKDFSEPIIIPKHNPPHIPPRNRNHIKLDVQSEDTNPPPIPPHRSLARSSAPARRSMPRRGHKSVKDSIKRREKIESNVNSQTFTKGNDNTWKKVTNNMNQNQLVEFFQNLKESNA